MKDRTAIYVLSAMLTFASFNAWVAAVKLEKLRVEFVDFQEAQNRIHRHSINTDRMQNEMLRASK